MNTTFEATLLRELQRVWHSINETYLRGALKPPVIAWTDGATRLGSWSRADRTLTIARELVLRQPWGAVVEVLKHEIAHQYVDEVLQVRDETAHGPAFREICGRMGIDPAASGAPQSTSEDPVLRKIQRLLALADSPNPHEAEAAMNAAHRLMLKHNIAWASDAETRDYHFRQVGEISGRVDAAEKVLAGIIASHFFVRAIWVPAYDVYEDRRGRVLELCGTAANLDIAVYVHGYLLETAERLWREHKRKHRITSDKERRRFMAGVMTGFHEKLTITTRECRVEGLVWVGDAQLEGFVERRHPYLRRTKTRVTHSQEYDQGRAAGRQIVLRKPVEAKAERRGRLLTGD